MIETLAAEVAPEPPARAWLLEELAFAGRGPSMTSFLSELTQAAEGRLCREPRFRAWLREEWTAWARQRYRRVARWAGRSRGRAGDERTSALPMIRVILERLEKRFGAIAAVDGASLELRPGEMTYVLGPPGAGKTTLARLVAGLEMPDDGEIYFGDRLVHTLPPHERGVGMVFRGPRALAGIDRGRERRLPAQGPEDAAPGAPAARCRGTDRPADRQPGGPAAGSA